MTHNDADRWIVSLHVLLFGKIAKIHVHLPDIFVFYGTAFQVYKYEAPQNSMIKYQVNVIVCVIDGKAILPFDKSEAFAKFEKKHLHIVYQFLLQITLLILFFVFKAKKLQRVGALYHILGCLYLLAFMR